MTNTENLQSTMRAEYSEYYQINTSDSTKASRRQLLTELMPVIMLTLQQQPSVKILDVGAGRQVLEAELSALADFKVVNNRVDLTTLDLADITPEQLLTSSCLHVQAAGDTMPFRDEHFDIVISSSALDFMPHAVFTEIYRVLSVKGTLLATFHHPSLLESAQGQLTHICNQLRTVDQKLKFGAQSRKIEKFRARRKSLEIELRDTEFILSTLPALLFQSITEITNHLEEHHFRHITIAEYPITNQQNGWYFARAQK